MLTFFFMMQNAKLLKLVLGLLCIYVYSHTAIATNSDEVGDIAVELNSMAEVVNVETKVSYPSSSVAFTTDEYESVLRAIPSLSSHRPRIADKILESKEQSEGRGARVRRSIGRPEIRNFDPFLMLDEFNVKLPASFTDHPHRGMETVTYLLHDSEGDMLHEDSVGNKGRISAGDVQWMTAGRGILHAEVPSSATHATRGMQLWLNLPKSLKMTPPRYQDKKNSELARGTMSCGWAEVVAGVGLGVRSSIETQTPIHYVYYRLQPNCILVHPIESDWNTFIYTLKGSIYIKGDNTNYAKKLGDFVGDVEIPHHHVATFKAHTGNGITISTATSTPYRFDNPDSENTVAEFILVSGKPIGEPIVQYGPFVMNTNNEIEQAFRDYRSSGFGFENARHWRSEISKLVEE